MDTSQEDESVQVQTSKKKLLPWESGEFNSENTDKDLSASYLIYSTSIPITNLEHIETYEIEKNNLIDMKAMEAVSRESVPNDSNIIGSHVRYVRKPDGKVKVRICPWGNNDTERNHLRTDALSMLVEVLRIVISIGVEKFWDIGSMDVRAAFLQAKGFNRTIYVRHPHEEKQPNILWKLLAAANGLVDSGRLWYLTSNSALCNSFGLIRSAIESTLY